MRKSISLAVLVSVPLLFAMQEAPKATPPGGQLSAAKGQFMRDGTPIKTGEKVKLFNGKDTSGWKLRQEKITITKFFDAEGKEIPGAKNGKVGQKAHARDAKRKELGVEDEMAKVPGVTTLMMVRLGENNINIVRMQCALEKRGGNALLIIGSDTVFPAAVLDKIKSSSNILSVKVANLS